MSTLPTHQEIARLALQAGLNLPDPYLQELAEAYCHVRRMVDRIPHDWTYGDEPAHVFVATRFTPKEA
jgi:hypothetical protein